MVILRLLDRCYPILDEDLTTSTDHDRPRLLGTLFTVRRNEAVDPRNEMAFVGEMDRPGDPASPLRHRLVEVIEIPPLFQA
jgi:hypothetical protein